MHRVTALVATLAEALQSLPLNVALVNPDGTISQVNAGWRDFASANGLRSPNACVGLNYFDYCTPDQVHALKAIVAGHRDIFSCLYPCHSADEARWMVLVAAPLSFEFPTSLIMLHFNITKFLLSDIAGQDVHEANLSEPGAALALMPIVQILSQTIHHSIALARIKNM